MTNNPELNQLSFDEITKIILRGECEVVEFKETYNVHFAKYCNTVAAFANGKGGYLIFGVRDDGQIIGVPTNEKQRKNIINFILGYVKPSVDIETYVVPTSTGENIFVIKVAADPTNIHSSMNVFYKRVDSQNKPMEPNEIKKYFETNPKSKPLTPKKEMEMSKPKPVAGGKKKGSMNEISTILFKIRPYLIRLGYDANDLELGEQVTGADGKVIGFTDIGIKLNNKLAFIIEAKRDNATLTKAHVEQALGYGKALKVPFVALTNGLEFQLYNSITGNRLSLKAGRFFNALPYKKDLKSIIDILKKKPSLDNLQIEDRPQVYKKGVNKNELIKIFKKCHNTIRDIEKDDEHAFSDFSKVLFLKLLEEKSEIEANEDYGYRLPRGWHYFDELRNNPSAGQVMQDIKQMFNAIKEDKKYGDIFQDDIFHADNEDTYKFIVDALADISFQDSEVDAKGSAFEYFCKFNLKGSKLGQYFTPREVVNLMVDFIDLKELILSLSDTKSPRVIDPSCGTGGFLIQGMQRLIEEVKKKKLPKEKENKFIKRIKEEVFWGSDANPTIARTAKMNMVIAGDGSSNIHKGNSLSEDVDFLSIDNTEPSADFVLANPPFGMSESRLPEGTLRLFDVHTTKGQALFIQKMIKLTKPMGRICTIVDEGILNNPKMEDIRRYMLKTCYVEAIVSLPPVTFKPNYTNVKTSFLLLTKKESELETQDYPIFMCDLKQIGYDSSYIPTKPTSSEINGDVLAEFHNFRDGNVDYKKDYKDSSIKEFVEDKVKLCFQLTVDEIEANYKLRMDVRYNNPHIVKFIHKLKKAGAVNMGSLLAEPVIRGASPKYVEEGLPVLKVRNLTKRGINWETDFGSEDFYENAKRAKKIATKGDVLIASTGVGSLGKCCVVHEDRQASIDGHIAVLRIANKKLDLDFLNDYLWSSFGQKQFTRLYSGSTGQIEIYPDDLEQLLVLIPKEEKQKTASSLIAKSKREIDNLNEKIAELEAETIKSFEKLVL